MEPAHWGAHHYVALEMANQAPVVWFFHSIGKGLEGEILGHTCLAPYTPSYFFLEW